MTPRAGKPQGASLHSVIIAGVLLIVAVMMLFVAQTLVPYISGLLTDNAIERTRETVLQSVSSVDLFMSRMLSTLNFASTTLPDGPEENTDWHGAFSLLARADSSVTCLAFFDEQGRCLYATAGTVTEAPATVAQADWHRLALERSGSVTCFCAPRVQHLFGSQRVNVLPLSRKVTYQSGGREHTGVLLMDVDYASFSALTGDIRLGSSGYAYILDAEGALISHPSLQLIYAGLKSEDTAAVERKILGLTRDTVQGRERVLVVASLSQTRWRMVGVAYIDELLQGQTAFLRVATVCLLAAACLALGAAALLAGFITRPIIHLEHKMRKVEAGDLNVTISEKGFREIRAVSAAFNHMLRRIRELMDQNLQEQETRRLYELNALQAQINPHFLYNTLDSIIWMEERGKSREAITMVSALARLFRISISKGRSVIAVSEELEHVRNYVIIQKMRFKEKFECVIEGTPEAQSERTVKLILQPIVENAINHAIDEIAGDTLHIAVKAFVTETELRFTVEDDGVGIPEEQLREILTRPAGKSGIGLKNVHERIRLTYGAPYGLEIASEEGEGTTVLIRLPRGREGAE